MRMALLLSPMLLAAAAPQSPSTSLEGLPLGAIPRQDLPARGCAAYLWTATGARALVAMAQADPARLRVSIGGTVTDLERNAQAGAGGFGFGETNDYGGGSVSAKLTMKIETRESIVGGAVVSEGVLQLDRTGQDTVVLPVSGIVGCAT